MNYLYAPIAGLIIAILNLICPILVLLALPFTKWDSEPSADQWGRGSVIRGDLPKWLSWFSTPDERLPGGLYEPAHKALLEKYGKTFASWVWLGWRNRMFGMAIYFGKPAKAYIPDKRGFYKNNDVWQYSVQFWKLRFVTGYKVYRLLDGSFWAAPCFTLMYRPK